MGAARSMRRKAARTRAGPRSTPLGRVETRRGSGRRSCTGWPGKRAALGDRHGALQELEGADVSAALAVPAPDMVEDGDLRGGGAAARRGKALRRAGCPTAAETALAEAVAARLHRLAPSWTSPASEPPEGTLTAPSRPWREAYLTARTAGSRRSEAKVRHIAATLPDSAATRSLADLIPA
jgi:hypothetical protein